MVYDRIESSHNSDFFLQKIPVSLHACAMWSELPSNISTMARAISIEDPTRAQDFCSYSVMPLVLIVLLSDGSSENGANIWSKSGTLISSRH